MPKWIPRTRLDSITIRNCSKCGASLKNVDHLFKLDADEARGTVNWLCHRCAEQSGFPCHYCEIPPKKVDLRSLYEEQLAHFEDRVIILELMKEGGHLGGYLSNQLLANLKVIEELKRRISDLDV